MGHEPGELIDDRFRLIERLGSGAMGAVWRALDEVLQREVALKEVRPADPTVLSDPDYAAMLRTRVLREARALARIQHPHVVTIHHVIDLPDDDHPWLVMELVRGGTLEDRLAAGPMEPAEAAELGRGLLSALRAAHADEICHRDVKPANVLLRPDGSPVLTDFGIADLADTSRLTATGGLAGSPAYIAPERLHGSEGNPASDLWSLGMLLYVAVEGVHPLRRTTAAATLAAVLTGVVPAANRAGPLEPALRAALVADPADRASAETLDALLRNALEPGPPGLALPVDAPGQAASGASLPPGEGSSTVLRPPYLSAKRKSRTPIAVWSVVGVLTLALIAGAVVAANLVGARLREQTALSAGQPPASQSPESSQPETSEPPEAEPAQVNLHTKQAMERAIKTYQAAIGTTEFIELVVYQEYAVATVPVQGRKKAYDKYIYRNDQVESGSSGRDTGDGETIDVTKIDWAILPKLMKRADEELNVPEPENRYLILSAASTFADGKPRIDVHLTDKYGGGYLTADLDGKIIDINPAE